MVIHSSWQLVKSFLAHSKSVSCLLRINLDPEVLFGNVTAPQMPLATHGANSHHPQKVTKFSKHVVTQCSHHHLVERIAQLQKLLELNDTHLQELEAIDKQLTKILLEANRHLS